MSRYEEVLKEWKQRDPYLLDFEGFERFLKEKSKETQVHLTVSMNHDYSYSIFIELDVTFGEHLEEQEISRKDQDRIIQLSESFAELVKRIELRYGATYVFRKDGKWWYWGDFDHCPKEDLMFNVEQLCKLWQTVGRHIKGAFGVSKAYDHTLYIDTLSDTEQWLQGITIIHSDMSGFLTNINHQPIHRLNKPEFKVSGEWLTLEEVTKSLLGLPMIDDCWLERRDELIPIACVYKDNVVAVEDFIAKQREVWNPFTDYDIQRNDMFDLLHPALQKELTLVWNDSLVLWEEDAAKARKIFLTKFDLEELQAKKVSELQEICRIKKIDASGRKDELTDRIAEWDITNLPKVKEFLKKIKEEPSREIYDYSSIW